MASSIDFILPSCYGIPESMWLAASNVLNAILSKCWMLLGAFVVVKMIASAFMDIGEERFSIRTQFRILGQAFLIAVFFIYYKVFLMTFDYMIDSLSSFKEEAMLQIDTYVKPEISKKSTIPSWFPIKSAISQFILYIQEGPSLFMHYIKSVSLLILSLLGPFASLFSLLPGPFKGSFKTWSKGYINVSCWTITLAILEVLTAAFKATLGEENWQIRLSIVLFIMTFFVPTWTSKLIGSINLGNVAAGVGRVPGSIVTGTGAAWKGAQSAALTGASKVSQAHDFFASKQ